MIIVIPLIGLVKRVQGSLFILVSAVFAAGAATLYSSIIIRAGTGEAGLEEWIRLSYILTQSGTEFFIACLGFLIIRQTAREKQAVLQAQVESEQQVARELRRIDSLKDQFLANTSHELRTPLQGIIGLSEALVEKVPEANQRQDLRMIVSSGRRLASMVNDILDFSKLRNQDLKLHLRRMSLYPLVEIIVHNSRPLAQAKSITLVNAVSRDTPPVFADENRLQQILFNLVGNAIKFSEAGQVEIGVRQDDDQHDMITVYVADTGIGIPQDKQDDIFKAFEQVDGADTRQFAGTGLGLSISKNLVELHGGKIWVESRSKGDTGSTFYFTLPAASDKGITQASDAADAASVSDDLTAVTTPMTTPGQPAGEGKNISVPAGAEAKATTHILTVDDEPINQRVLASLLADKNFQLTQAMTGREALQAIEDNPNFDLVLLDIMMPRMSGYEVCQRIRETYLPSELPVIMVTAKDQIPDIVQGLSLGANDYLPKPFSKEELLARINTQLDLHRIFNATERFVPSAFLRTLGRERITEVELGDHAEREVTVLFADIRDYTAMAETMTPEENFKFVNAFHGRMGPIIQRYGGFVNQYLGDAIMAIFPDSPEKALQSAIGMQERLRQYNLQRQKQQRVPIRIGIGLHTGTLIMGIIGDQIRMDAATIADTVNTASRIENLTKYYGCSILLSTDSLHKITRKTDFHLRHLGKVLVKGKNEPIGIYECYDGDSPEIREQKMASVSYFEKGLEHFYARNFPEAASVFNKILKKNAEDRTAKLFLNKASLYTLEGVPDDWTGVEVMTFK